MIGVTKSIELPWMKPVLGGLILFILGGWGWSHNVAAAPKPGEAKTVDLGGGVTMDFVWCPPGEFLMGSPVDEKNREFDERQHRVKISCGFYLGKFEVTQAQWERVMGSNPSGFKNAGRNAPVENVSWDDCQAFCRKAGSGLRLPTEAEWEYACRAGTTGAFAGDVDRIAWYDDNGGSTTHPVGQKLQNAWGLYDMCGNVREWCADGYGAYPADAVTDPQGDLSAPRRVFRGSHSYDSVRYCRSAYRGSWDTSYKTNLLGLRVVFAPPGE